MEGAVSPSIFFALRSAAAVRIPDVNPGHLRWRGREPDNAVGCLTAYHHNYYIREDA